MLRRVLVLLFLICTCVMPARASWQNSLAPQGQKGDPIALATDGKTDYRLLLPQNPSDQQQKAADELSHWLNAMTNAEFPIVRETSNPPQDDPLIAIGQTTYAATLAPADVGREGYRIQQVGNSLILTGGELRGVINAVVCLLEEDLGCRWYAGDSSTIPSAPTLRARIVSRTFNPPLDVRYPFYFETRNPDWALRNRFASIQNRIPAQFGGGQRIPTNWFVHSFGQVLSPTSDFKAHPEYFALIDGKRSSRQLCLSNPDVLRITIEKARAALAACPTADFISISDYDGGGHCECPECKKLDDENSSPAGSNLTFVNEVAEALEKDHPNLTVLSLAYLDTLDAPKVVRPRHNVAVQLCDDLHSWRWPLLPFPQSDHFLSKRYIKAINDWSAICDRIYIWDYTTNFSNYIGPMPNIQVIEPSVRYYVDHHVHGIMFQGSYQSPGERGDMRCWVMSKILWNPSLKVDDLVDDFVQGYYQESAKPIAQYYQLLDEAGRANEELVNEQTGGIRFGMDAPFITRDFVTKASALLKQAELAATSDTIRQRVELEKVPLLYVKIMRGKSVCDDDRKALLDEFEEIAKRHHLTNIAEGAPDLMNKLAKWRAEADSPDQAKQVSTLDDRTLFIDDTKVASMQHLSRVMHQPKKRGAVLTPDTGAGETMIQARSAPMWIPAENLYRMQYIAVLEGSWKPLIAESGDGIHWTRPDFGRGGAKPFNRVKINASDAKWSDIENVLYDPRDPDPARRYKAIVGPTGRVPAVSADCREFNLLDVSAIPSGDESQLEYDAPHNQFVASVKTFTAFGRSVGISSSADFTHWTPVTNVFSTDVDDQQRARRVIKDRVNDKMLMPLAFVDPEPPPDYVPKLAGNATWGCDVYNMAIFPYEGGYIGMPAIFYRTGPDERGTNTDGFHEIQLTWSRDMHQWQRLGDRAAFIGPSRIDMGRLGVFDRTQLLPTSCPIVHGDELWFYYTGLKWRDNPYNYHADRTERKKSEWTKEELADEQEGTGAVCLAVLRRDGFISLDAGDALGELVTRSIPIRGEHLYLNLDAEHGEARVELLEAGHPVPGFALDDCTPITGDNPRATVRWKTADVKQLKDEMVTARIVLTNASLYSVWSAD